MAKSESDLTRDVNLRERRDRNEERDRAGRFQDFGAGHDALLKSTDFFSKHSNADSWANGGISGDEYDALRHYTGSGYSAMNKNLYTKDYKDMSPTIREKIQHAEKGLSKFELQKGIQVTRQADFKIFGAKSGDLMSVAQVKDYIKKNGTNGVLQNDGFLSAGANNHGAAIDGWGLVLHFKVPPSIGAGAYVNPISMHEGAGENEFLFNSRSRFKFDLSSIRKDSSGRVHVTAVWVGRGKKLSHAK